MPERLLRFSIACFASGFVPQSFPGVIVLLGLENPRDLRVLPLSALHAINHVPPAIPLRTRQLRSPVQSHTRELGDGSFQREQGQGLSTPPLYNRGHHHTPGESISSDITVQRPMGVCEHILLIRTQSKCVLSSSLSGLPPHLSGR